MCEGGRQQSGRESGGEKQKSLSEERPFLKQVSAMASYVSHCYCLQVGGVEVKQVPPTVKLIVLSPAAGAAGVNV